MASCLTSIPEYQTHALQCCAEARQQRGEALMHLKREALVR